MSTTETEWDAAKHRPWAVLCELNRSTDYGDPLISRTCIMVCPKGCVLRTEERERDTDAENGGYRIALVFVPEATLEDFFGKDVPHDAVTWVA